MGTGRGSWVGAVTMIYAFGEYTFDTQLYELRRAGDLIPLGPQVFNVLGLSRAAPPPRGPQAGAVRAPVAWAICRRRCAGALHSSCTSSPRRHSAGAPAHPDDARSRLSLYGPRGGTAAGCPWRQRASHASYLPFSRLSGRGRRGYGAPIHAPPHRGWHTPPDLERS